MVSLYNPVAAQSGFTLGQILVSTIYLRCISQIASRFCCLRHRTFRMHLTIRKPFKMITESCGTLGIHVHTVSIPSLEKGRILWAACRLDFPALLKLALQIVVGGREWNAYAIMKLMVLLCLVEWQLV